MPKKVTKKVTKHRLVKTRVWMLWCRGCSYIHAPELEMELQSDVTVKHHKSPYGSK